MDGDGKAFDYVIVGAGSAGCVLANRLSADPANRVLLLEAGGKDNNLMVRIPRASASCWATSGSRGSFPPSRWGSRSASRSGCGARRSVAPARSTGWSTTAASRPTGTASPPRRATAAWGWDEIVPHYKAMEDNQFGASPTRGTGGPLGISSGTIRSELTDDMIAAGAGIGLQRVDDLNELDGERIGYAMANIKGGERVSAAAAFLHPVAKRPNLTVAIDSPVTSLVFEGDKVVGVRVGAGRRRQSNTARRREVILALGSIHTPKLLQLSGIGPSDVLRAAGIDVRVDQPNVGGRMREHHRFALQYRLRENLGYNRKLSSPLAQAMSGIQYLATKRGALAAPSYDIVGFLKTQPGSTGSTRRS